MESAGAAMSLLFTYTISTIEARRRPVRSRRLASGDIETDWEDLGWWVVLNPGRIAYFVGAERPDLSEGDEIEVRWTKKVRDAPAS